MSWGAPLTSTERRELEAREDTVRAKRKAADHHAAITGCVGTGAVTAMEDYGTGLVHMVLEEAWRVKVCCTADTAVREGVRHD